MRYNLRRQAEELNKANTRKKHWRRMACVLACIAMLVTAYALMMPALTMESTYNLSDAPTKYGLTTIVTVNGNTLSEDTTLENGDAFTFSVSWNLPTSGSYTTSDTFTYALPTGSIFGLTDADGNLKGEDGTTVYGTYKIENNVLTVQYNAAFLALSNKTTSVTANGAISITNTTTTSEDGYTVNIPGLESVTIHLKTNTGMTIKKESAKRIVGDDTEETHETWIDYTVTLTSNGTNNNVKLTDNFYIDEANPHRIGTTVPVVKLTKSGETTATDIAVTTNTNTTIDTTAAEATVKTSKGDTTLEGAVNSSDPHRTTTAFIPSMSTGDKLVITYSAKLVSEPNAVSHEYYGDAKIHNAVTAESEQCSKISDQKEDTLKMTYIDKEGGNVNRDTSKTWWRIYVYGGEYKTLTVKDVLPDGCNISPADNTEVKVYNATGKTATSTVGEPTKITFKQLKDGYKVTFPESGWVMLYFECDASADDCTVKNTAKIVETSKTAEYAFSHGHVSATTGTKKWLSATRATDTMSADYFDTKILNQIDITIGTESQSVTDFYFVDRTDDTSGGARVHHFPATVNETIVSIEVLDSTTNTYSEVADERFVISLKKENGSTIHNNSLYFEFRDNVITGTYRIKYYTLVEHEAYNLNNNDYTTINNYLYWSNGTTTESGGEDKQKWKAFSVLNKETKAAASVSNDQIVWKIGSLGLDYNLYDSNNSLTMRYENFRQYSTVVDTLPKGLTFVAAAYGNSNPSEGCEGAVTPTITKNNDGTTTLEFPMYSDTSKVQDLYILTKYDGDYDSLTAEAKYTNSVKIRLRTAKDGDFYEPERMKNIKATASIQPPVVASKSVKYDSSTVPYAEYTVTINSATSDMIPASATKQTFELHDEMGSALALDKSTLQINGKSISEYEELTLNVTGGGSAFVLSGLQDQTAYTITYKALVLLKAGETFTSENAKNKITIPGIDIPERDTTVTTITGQVFGSSGSAGGATGLVRVYKVDNNTPANAVAGAGFTIYKIGNVGDVTSLPAADADVSELEVAGTLSTDADGYTEFKQLSYGVIYGIKETTVPDGYSDPAGGAMRYFAYKAWDATTLPFEGQVQDLSGNSAYTFEFVNYPTVELTITKKVDGATSTDESFPFALTSDIAMISGTGYTLSADGKTATFDLKNNGKVTLTVYQGSKITLNETQHDGYTVLIKENGAEVANGDSATINITGPGDRTITVHNSPGVVLPATGGVGTHIVILIGLLLMATATIFGYRLWRKQD